MAVPPVPRPQDQHPTLQETDPYSEVNDYYWFDKSARRRRACSARFERQTTPITATLGSVNGKIGGKLPGSGEFCVMVDVLRNIFSVFNLHHID